MSTKGFDVGRLEDPERQLEQAFIEEFLRARGYDPSALGALPDDQRKRLLEQASVYAAGKLTEVNARAHLVHDLHRED